VKHRPSPAADRTRPSTLTAVEAWSSRHPARDYHNLSSQPAAPPEAQVLAGASLVAAKLPVLLDGPDVRA